MRVLVFSFVIAVSVLSAACAETTQLPSGLNYSWGSGHDEDIAPGQSTSYRAGDGGKTTEKMAGVPPMPALRKPPVAEEILPVKEVVFTTPRAPLLGETLQDTFDDEYPESAAQVSVPPTPGRVVAPLQHKIELPADIMNQLAADGGETLAPQSLK